MAARKRCTASDCQERIKSRHAFCETHFSKIPWGIRTDLMDGYRKGDGQKVIASLNKARAFLADTTEKTTMPTGKSDLVDVTLEYRRESPTGSSIGFFQGEVEEDGRGGQREIWIWLPKSQIEIDGEQKHGKTVEVAMPEWLAMDKWLI